MCCRLATDCAFRVQVVLAPQGWKQASTLKIMGESPGIARQGHDTNQDTVVNLIFAVTWTQEKDPEYGLDPSEIAKKKLTVFEQRRLERQQEALERKERAERQKQAGPTFFGGGRLGNAVEIEAAARNGENWSKRNAITLNSDKRREAQLRALAAAETRRLGSSGRVADKRSASILQTALADASSQVGRALRESGIFTHDARRQDTLADAATRRQQAFMARGQKSAQSNVHSILPTKQHSTSVRIPYPRADHTAPVDTSVHSVPANPPKQVYAHREGLLTAHDLDRYASMNQSSANHDYAPPHNTISRAWSSNTGTDLDNIRAAATAVNASSFLASPRTSYVNRQTGPIEGVHYGRHQVHDAVGASTDEQGDDLLARARALISAGQAVTAALSGVGGGRAGSGGHVGEGGGQQRYEPAAHVAPWDRAGFGAGHNIGEEGEQNEMDMLARIRGIARAILSGDEDGVLEEAEETYDVEKPQILEGGGLQSLQASFGERLAAMEGSGAREKGDRGAGVAGWAPWMEENAVGGDGGVYAEPSTATLPSVQSRAESDLSEGIPMAGRGVGRGGGGSGWGMLEEEEVDGVEQRVVLQGMRLRGHVCGHHDNPEISFVLKIDMGGFKCRTNKERRLRGEVSWKDRCELDLVGATSTLRVRVVRCRQPRSASQSVDSVIGECEISVDQLEGSDRAVSWGWHRVLGLGAGGDTAASGEIYLGIERFRVPGAGEEADAPLKESKGTMPDEMLAPDLDDPLSKGGASALLQRSWRCHLARRAARATIQWRESLQRKSHRAYPGSLNGLQPPSKQAQLEAAVATGKGGKDGNSKVEVQQPREGVAAMYSVRRPPAPRGLPFGAPATGKGGQGWGQSLGSYTGGVPSEMYGAGAMGGGGLSGGANVRFRVSGAVGGHPADGSVGGGQGRQFALDALFPLGKTSKTSFRLPPSSGVTDARGAGGAAERAWGGGGEGQAGLYGSRPGYGGSGEGGAYAAPGAHDLGGNWDKIQGAAALLLG